MTALTLNVPDQNPITGFSHGPVKPITEGTEATVVAQSSIFGGIFGALDNLGTSVVNGVSSVASAVAQKEVNKLVTGPEASFTDEGDPFAAAGNTTPNVATQPFYVTYQKELLIGGGIIGASLVLYMVTK